MITNSLSEYIIKLERNDELIRISEFVDPVLEISEISNRIMKQEGGGKALLFENTGTNFPVLINHYGSDSRVLTALNLNSYDEPGERINALMSKLMSAGGNFSSKLALLPELNTASSWMPRKSNKKAPCQDVIIKDPDLSIFPIIKCWPFDGGKFITLPMVITEDPETGIRNAGMYRMQIFDKNTTGMHWHLHKGGAAHYEKYRKLGRKMPVSVVLGGDPALTYCATAPLPENIDELMLAGFLKNKSVSLSKSITNNILIPSSADIVIEGYIDPMEDLKKEGPFGDHTGFYSLDDLYPVFHVTCITHRKDAVYPATIVGIPPMEDFYLGKATERIFLKPIQITIAPEIIDIRLPSYGVAHNLVFIKAKTTYAGQSFKIMNALLGAGQMMFSKVLICFDETVDIHNDQEAFDTISTRLNIYSIIIEKGPSDVLDHSAYTYTFSGKLLIDLTKNNNNKTEFKDVKQKDIKYHYKNTIICGIEQSTNINDFIKGFLNNKPSNSLQVIALIDNFVNFETPALYAWYILNNIDPSHDCKIIDNNLIINACIKTKHKNNFNRRWPNIVSMNTETINKIDQNWYKYFNFPLISSPSNTIKDLIKGNSEIVDPNIEY
jgi:4-hydroxy-3-polyprenylbenzoate decarboxylase